MNYGNDSENDEENFNGGNDEALNKFLQGNNDVKEKIDTFQSYINSSGQNSPTFERNRRPLTQFQQQKNKNNKNFQQQQQLLSGDELNAWYDEVDKALPLLKLSLDEGSVSWRIRNEALQKQSKVKTVFLFPFFEVKLK